MDADAQARTLARLDERRPVRLVVDGEPVAGVPDSMHLGDDCIRVELAERGGDRRFRVETYWMDGWLESLVDVRGPADSGFEPAGLLDGVAAE
jgi:hypothetical protein